LTRSSMTGTTWTLPISCIYPSRTERSWRYWWRISSGSVRN